MLGLEEESIPLQLFKRKEDKNYMEKIIVCHHSKSKRTKLYFFN